MAFCRRGAGPVRVAGTTATSPAFPLAKTAAMVNLDMVGRLRDDQKTEQGQAADAGARHGQGVQGADRGAGEEARLHARRSRPSGFGPSDHASRSTARRSRCCSSGPTYTRTTTSRATRRTGSTTPACGGWCRRARTRWRSWRRCRSPSTSAVKRRQRHAAVDGAAAGHPAGLLRRQGRRDRRGRGERQPGRQGRHQEGRRHRRAGGQAGQGLKTYMVIMAEQKPKTTIEVEVTRKDKKVKLKVPLE